MAEHDEQRALLDWCNINAHRIPELALIFAIPNGGKRAIKTAARLKLEGVKAGVPDLFLPIARGRMHGMFIEMKFGRNKSSPLQQAWQATLKEQGYHVYTAWTWLEATAAIRLYLGV